MQMMRYRIYIDQAFPKIAPQANLYTLGSVIGNINMSSNKCNVSKTFNE